MCLNSHSSELKYSVSVRFPSQNSGNGRWVTSAAGQLLIHIHVCIYTRGMGSGILGVMAVVDGHEGEGFPQNGLVGSGGYGPSRRYPFRSYENGEPLL